MKPLSAFIKKMPRLSNIILAVLSAILLILAFPDFELWFLAWIAFVPFVYSVFCERQSLLSAGILGWVFGTIFFFGSCWWLTFAPITYAGFPSVLAYFLLFCAAAAVGLFPALFSLLLAFLLKRLGNYAILSAPFLWASIEFLRFWLTGNNWNAVGYSQAFNSFANYASFGGVLFVGFCVVSISTIIVWYFFFLQTKLGADFTKFENISVPFRRIKNLAQKNGNLSASNERLNILASVVLPFAFLILFTLSANLFINNSNDKNSSVPSNTVIALQPNVPMNGLHEQKWRQLRKKHVEMAENALTQLKNERQRTSNDQQTTIIFPESPMNFMYERDEEFQKFIGDFAIRNNVNVLFNAAEPDREQNSFFNSAVLVNSEGRKIAQYDKIYLVPFGESVPAPLQNIMPALVGSFSFGNEYDLLPFGDALGGVMICFESHFPNLSREYVLRGADVLIELTNDGYLGKTPVLRQHLANAVFRAVETNRPLLRVTNVGITAYINEQGEVLESAESYTEATRVWTINKSNGEQTFYVKYGDWFAWVCSFVSLGLIIFGLSKKRFLENEA